MAQSRWLKFLGKLNSPLMRKGEYKLDHVRQFHEALGSPGESLNIVHVAGTNAKGTVTYKLAKMLEMSGHKTGLFISPHLFSWRERVQINDQLISKEDCEDFIDIYDDLVKKLGVDLSFFEFFTVLAYYHFKKQKVDVAVIEVGLGGRLDATNILDKSLLSIITSISFDHVDALGNTLDKICEEKAGIIKPNCDVLIGPQVPFSVVSKIAGERNATIHKSIPGRSFKDENENLLRTAAKLLNPKLNISPQAEHEAISNWELPCRLEALKSQYLKNTRLKSVHFDVGHNPDAVEKTLELYRTKVDMSKTAIVYGCKPLKDCGSCLDILLMHNPRAVYAVSSKDPNSKAVLTAPQIQALRPDHVKMEGGGDINETLEKIVSDPGVDHVLVIGSFTVMRESRAFFGIADPTD